MTFNFFFFFYYSYFIADAVKDLPVFICLKPWYYSSDIFHNFQTVIFLHEMCRKMDKEE